MLAARSWLFIYIMQLPMIIYTFTTIFRMDGDCPLYVTAPLIRAEIYVLYSVALFLNYIWLLLIDHKYFSLGAVSMAIMACILYTCVAIAVVALAKTGPTLVAQGKIRDVKLVRMFVKNFIGLLAMWSNIVALNNLSIVLCHSFGISEPNASIITSSIMLAEISIWSVIDFFLLKDYTLYVFAPYMRLCVDTGMNISVVIPYGSGLLAVEALILIVTFSAILMKMSMLTWRFCKGGEQALEPFYYAKASQPLIDDEEDTENGYGSFNQ